MNSQHVKQLLDIARRKNQIDQSSDWCNGSNTYLSEIKLELDEVAEELQHQPLRQPHLEQELGDVFWDYLNLLICLEQEDKISLAKVFSRASEKYCQRIDGIEKGQSWDEIKQIQKIALEKELKK